MLSQFWKNNKVGFSVLFSFLCDVVIVLAYYIPMGFLSDLISEWVYGITNSLSMRIYSEMILMFAPVFLFAFEIKKIFIGKSKWVNKIFRLDVK